MRISITKIYYEKMSSSEQYTLSSAIHMAQQLGLKPCLRDAMAVLDEDNLKYAGMQAAAKPPKQIIAKLPINTVAASTSLDPGPLELGAIAVSSKSNQCAQCKGCGHWSPAYGTSRNWKYGDPIAGRLPGGRGPSSR